MSIIHEQEADENITRCRIDINSEFYLDTSRTSVYDHNLNDR